MNIYVIKTKSNTIDKVFESKDEAYLYAINKYIRKHERTLPSDAVKQATEYVYKYFLELDESKGPKECCIESIENALMLLKKNFNDKMGFYLDQCRSTDIEVRHIINDTIIMIDDMLYTEQDNEDELREREAALYKNDN